MRSLRSPAQSPCALTGRASKSGTALLAALPSVIFAALLAAPVFAASVPPAGTALAAPSLRELGELSIEELSQIRVTSASRRPEPLSEVTSAIYVITGDDIRRSGAATLAE